MVRYVYYVLMDNHGIRSRKSVHVEKVQIGMDNFVCLDKIVMVVWYGIKIHIHVNVLLLLYGMVVIVLPILVSVEEFGIISIEYVNA